LLQGEIQAYYFLPLPGYNSAELKRNILRAYTTARTIIRVAGELTQERKFMLHTPHFYFRNIHGATSLIHKVLRSSYIDFIDRDEAEKSALDAAILFQNSVIQEDDLAARISDILKSCPEWSRLPRWHDEPISGFSHRLGACLTLDCLKRLKEDIAAMPKNQPPAAEGSETPNLAPAPDPLVGVDWSFMDDFTWDFEPNVMVPVAQ
jgi:transcriptional regulatory protein LEU3